MPRKSTICRKIRQPALERFNKKYKVDSFGCWIWTAGKKGADKLHSYGMFYMHPHYTSAQRAAYTLFVGPIPEGLHVLHKCDVPACVNPEHLWLGNHTDNMRDRLAKNRYISQKSCALRGERNSQAKLSQQAVLDIRQRCAHGESQESVAKLYSISQIQISRIVHRKRWAHI